MRSTEGAPVREVVVWMDDGSPHSPRFQDRYRSRTGALAQAVAVFVGACGLPQRWRGRPAFTVLETGFGMGLNFLATWAAWAEDPERCACLHFVSVEAYPVAAADILRNALSPESAGAVAPQLIERMRVLAPELARAWGALSPGLQRWSFAGGRVQLTLAVGQVLPMLDALGVQADAVYLDGFSPDRNPDMWSPATLAAMARHCRPGTVLASYTVALPVRESLQRLGFTVRKRQGLPPKRHRLEAVLVAPGTGRSDAAPLDPGAATAEPTMSSPDSSRMPPTMLAPTDTPSQTLAAPGFDARPVPRAVIAEILALASRAPSGVNTQPWHVTVLQGAALERLKAQALDALALVRSDATAQQQFWAAFRALPGRSPWRGPAWEQSGSGFAAAANAAFGAGRIRGGDDLLPYFAFYGAPVALMCTIDRSLGLGSVLDCGMFLQTLVLAAQARGLQAEVQAGWRGLAGGVLPELQAGAGQDLLAGVALGYAAATSAVVDPVPVPAAADFITWHG